MVHQVGIISCIACLFCLLNIGVKANANTSSQFHLRQYGSELGLEASEIYSIATGADGHLWLGTGNGLYWFDGHHFQRFDHKSGFASSICLLVKPIGKEYILVAGTWPDFLYLIKGTQIIYKWELPFNMGNSQLLGWQGDRSNLTIFSGMDHMQYNLQSGASQVKRDHRILCISGVLDRPNRPPLITYDDDNRFFSIDQGQILPFDSVSATYINGITTTQKGEIICWTDEHLYKLSNDLQELGHRPSPSGNEYGGIRQMFMDRNEQLWFISNSGILYWERAGKVFPILNDQLDQNCQINSWHEDPEGNIWIGTEGKGLFCLPATEFYNFNQGSGLGSDYITCLKLGPDNSLYIGSYTGLDVLPGHRMELDKYSPLPVNTAKEGPGIALTMGLHEGALFSYEGFFKYPHEEQWSNKPLPLFASWVSSATIDEKTVVLGRWGALTVLKKEDNKWTKGFKLGPEPQMGKVNALMVHKDSLWIAAAGGLFCMDLQERVLKSINLRRDSLVKSGRESLVQARNDLSPNKADLHRPYCYTLVLDKEERIWLGAQDGTYIRSGQNWERLHHASEEIGKTRSLTVDPKERIWIGTENGLKIYDQGEIRTFSTSNGLAGNQVRKLLPDLSRNLMWIGTTTGLSALSLDLEFSPQKSQLKFLSITELHHQSQLSASTFELPYDQNSLQIRFSAFYHIGPGEVQYQYRLLGADSLWHSTVSNEAWLMSLSPGSYRFEARSLVPGKSWSNSEGIDFIIHPPFWQKAYFQIGVLLTLLIILSLVFLKRTSTIRLREANKRKYLREIHNLEQQVLRASLNPHFVFNALNSIQHYLVRYQDKSGIKFISGLARLIRTNMDTAQQRAIPLQEELDRLQLYLDLEKTRLKENLQFKIDLHPELAHENPMIPNMILQPIVENAIWHGIAPSNDPGEIMIFVQREDQHRISIEIKDNGVGLKSSSEGSLMIPHTSKGLQMIRQRIAMYDERNTLELLSNPDGRGACARFTLFIDQR